VAHFYGSIKGQRGEATRCGAKCSGYRAMAQGWQGGLEVYLYHDDNSQTDQFAVFLTGGGNGCGRIQLASGELDYNLIIKGGSVVDLNEDMVRAFTEHRAREIMTKEED